VLYNLPAVREAVSRGGLVFVVEGEERADALNDLGGLVATSGGGVSGWLDSYADSLAGEHVTIAVLLDTGEDWSRCVVQSLTDRARVKLLRLPGPVEGHGENVVQWIERGRAEGKSDAALAAELVRLADAAREVGSTSQAPAT